MTIYQTAWETLDSTLKLQTKESQFWWDTTGRMFAKLLEHGGYTTVEQYRELQFYALFVAPQLGPTPDDTVPWKLLRAPDCTPIDFSWDWASKDKAVLRYAFEPISLETSGDRSPSDVWLHNLKDQGLAPGLDLELYKHFVAEMLPADINHKGFEGKLYERLVPKFGTAVAVDVNRTGPMIKTYFWPDLKADELGISKLECVKRTVRALPEKHLQEMNAEPLLEYLDEATEKWGWEIFIVALDCLGSKDARIKIYVRSRWTSRECLMDALTMGGRLEVDDEGALAALIALWDTFLGDAPDKLPDEIGPVSCPGFYYTLGYGAQSSVKMYVSPQDFCATDAEVLSKMRKYFASQNKPEDMVDNYESAVRSIFDSKIVDSRCGSHYYVGCALHKGQARVVTYMSPQTFLLERDGMDMTESSSEDTKPAAKAEES